MLKLNVMKQRFTRPAFKTLATKTTLVTAAIVLAFTSPMAIMSDVSADQYDDKINALQSQVDAYQKKAGVLQGKIGTLKDAIGKLQNERSVIQAKIDLNQAKYEKLQKQIKETQIKIVNNKNALGSTLADMYIDNSISPLEMLASSINIGDYVDKQSYRSSVSDQLQQTIQTINDLKDKLDKDKKSVATILNKQKAQKNSLIANEQEQQRILSDTKGKESAYQSMISAVQKNMADAAAQQAAYYRSLNPAGGGATSGAVGNFEYQSLSPSDGAGGCSGGYPAKWCGAPDTVADDYALWNRECVSYVAWALDKRFGKSVNSFQGSGYAFEWEWSAPRYSAARRVSSPRPGDVVLLPKAGAFAPVGHVMIVESVSGGWMHVSQFNFYGTHQYSTMDVRNSGVILLRFPNA